MATVPREVAVKRLKKAGMIADDSYGSPIYVDADCGHCGSRYKIGELIVTDEHVDATKLEEMMEDFENRS